MEKENLWKPADLIWINTRTVSVGFYEKFDCAKLMKVLGLKMWTDFT